MGGIGVGDILEGSPARELLNKAAPGEADKARAILVGLDDLNFLAQGAIASYERAPPTTLCERP